MLELKINFSEGSRILSPDIFYLYGGWSEMIISPSLIFPFYVSSHVAVVIFKFINNRKSILLCKKKLSHILKLLSNSSFHVLVV